MLGIYIKLENDGKTINHMSIGQMVNKKFNGIIYSTICGAYEDWYVYQDKLLPTAYKEGNEAVEHDTASQWLNDLTKDSNFTDKCYEKMSEYALHEPEHVIKKEKLIYFQNNCYSKNLGLVSKIVTNSDVVEYYDWSEFPDLFDCFAENKIYFDENKSKSCESYIKKEGQKVLREFDVYAIRNEQYRAKVMATSEEEAKMLTNENYSDYDFVEVDGTLDTAIVGLSDEPQYLYQLTRYDNWFSVDSLENFGVFSSKEKAIEAIENNIGPINNGDEDSFYWNGENQLMSNDMGSFQINKVELDSFGEY